MGKIEEARQAYLLLLEKYPDDPSVWKTYSSFLMGQGDIKGWEQAATRSVELIKNQTTDDFWSEINRRLSLGQAYFNLQSFEEAEQVLLDITIDLPYYFPAYSTLGYLYLSMKDLYKAEQAFTKALNLQPNNPYALVALTNTQMKIGSPGQARLWEENNPRFNCSTPWCKTSNLTVGCQWIQTVPWMGTNVES